MGLARLPPKIEPGPHTKMLIRAIELMKGGTPHELAFHKARAEHESNEAEQWLPTEIKP